MTAWTYSVESAGVVYRIVIRCSSSTLPVIGRLMQSYTAWIVAEQVETHPCGTGVSITATVTQGHGGLERALRASQDLVFRASGLYPDNEFVKTHLRTAAPGEVPAVDDAVWHDIVIGLAALALAWLTYRATESLIPPTLPQRPIALLVALLSLLVSDVIFGAIHAWLHLWLDRRPLS